MEDAIVEDLIKAIQQGGKSADDAFIQIDNWFRPLMHSILWRKFSVTDQGQREEYIQEAMLKLFSSLNKGQFIGNTKEELRKYLLAILRNHSISMLKKIKPENKGRTAEDVEALQGADDVKLPASCEEEALLAFCEKNKQAGDNLSFIALGLTLREIAELDGRGYGAMREYIRYTRKKLKQFTKEFCKE